MVYVYGKSKIALGLAVACAVVMMVPVVAQATTAQAPAGTELGVNAPLQMASANLKLQTGAGNIVCTNADLAGKITTNAQEDHVTAAITATTLTGCTGPSGVTADVASNAAQAAPWTLQIQQPEASGQITAHLLPAAAGSIQLSVQPQVFGFSTTTCDYTAPGVQLMGDEGGANNDVFAAEGANQFTRQAGSAEQCGTPGTLDGNLQLTSGGNRVTIDMT